jgi:transcriptional regulator with XRE-family HTH domain
METSKETKTPEIKIDYHKRIKAFRETKNYTQEHMAEVLHLSQRAYSSIENGQTQLTVERLYEIAEALKVSIGEIIGVENQNVFNNNFNNHALHNKGNLVFHQDAFDEQRNLYERLLASKDDEIKTLKERLGLKNASKK